MEGSSDLISKSPPPQLFNLVSSLVHVALDSPSFLLDKCLVLMIFLYVICDSTAGILMS